MNLMLTRLYLVFVLIPSVIVDSSKAMDHNNMLRYESFFQTYDSYLEMSDIFIDALNKIIRKDQTSFQQLASLQLLRKQLLIEYNFWNSTSLQSTEMKVINNNMCNVVIEQAAKNHRSCKQAIGCFFKEKKDMCAIVSQIYARTILKHIVVIQNALLYVSNKIEKEHYGHAEILEVDMHKCIEPAPESLTLTGLFLQRCKDLKGKGVKEVVTKVKEIIKKEYQGVKKEMPFLQVFSLI